MYYQLMERTNPLAREEAKKLYATPRYVGRITAEEIARQIAIQTTLTSGDVSNVLKTFLDLLPMYLLMGMSLELEGIGRMRLTFSSEGVADKKTFNTKMMRHLRVVFVSSPALRNRIGNVMTYEKLPEQKVPEPKLPVQE